MLTSSPNNTQHNISGYNGPEIKSGSVVRAFCKKANKHKWHLVLAKSADGLQCLTVLFNTNKPFQSVPHLARLQFHLKTASILFMYHDSYVNCAHPETMTLKEL